MTDRRQRRRTAAAGLAAAVLLAGCSNHSGLRRLRPTGIAASPVALPTAGPPSVTAAPPSGVASPSGSTPPTHRPSPSTTAGSTPPAESTAAAASAAQHRRSSGRPHHPRPGGRPTRSRSSTPAPPAPAVGAAPNGGLHDGEQVQVSGAHLSAGESVSVRECQRADVANCAGFGDTAATVGSTGTFRADLYVSSSVWLTACGHSGCVIRVRRSSGSVLLVPISFG